MGFSRLQILVPFGIPVVSFWYPGGNPPVPRWFPFGSVWYPGGILFGKKFK